MDKKTIFLIVMIGIGIIIVGVMALSPNLSISETLSKLPIIKNLFSNVAGPRTDGRIFLTGFEYELIDVSGEEWIWGSSVGSPTTLNNNSGAVSSFYTNGNPDNNWALKIEIGTPNKQYVQYNATESTGFSTHFSFEVARTLEGNTATDIFEYSNSIGLKQCFVQYDSGNGKLNLYYKDTSLECSGSTNDGTTCTSVSDCTESAGGEATCSPA